MLHFAYGSNMDVAAIVASKPTRRLNTDPKLSAAPKTPGLPAAD